MVLVLVNEYDDPEVLWYRTLPPALKEARKRRRLSFGWFIAIHWFDPKKRKNGLVKDWHLKKPVHTEG